MNDPFRHLPAPILLVIVKFSPDFTSLHRSIQASPVANSIFEELSVEITEALINRLPPDVAEIIQAFSVPLSKSWTNTKVPKPCRRQKLKQLYKPSLAKSTQYSLPCDITLSSVKDLLRVACRLHNLAALFFETYIKRINGIGPVHLVGPSHNFGSDKFGDSAEGRTYTRLQTGSASWVEELRVARALWLLQYGTTLTSQAICEIRLRCPPWVLDEMSCVNDFLIDNRISLYSPEADQPIQKASPHPVYSSILADPPPTDPSSKAWQRDAKAAKVASPANCVFGRSSGVSPLDDYSWLPFRRLGYDIWDLKRMCDLNLMDIS